jgi:septal ring factor EnvC (AmiA/AmiB activator)
MFSFLMDFFNVSGLAKWVGKNLWWVLILGLIVFGVWFSYSHYVSVKTELTTAQQTIGQNNEKIANLDKENTTLKKQIEQLHHSVVITDDAEIQIREKEQKQKQEVVKRQAAVKQIVKTIEIDPTTTQDKKDHQVSEVLIDDIWRSYCDASNADTQQCQGY